MLLPVADEGHAITFIKYEDILIKCDRQNDHGVNDNIVFYKISNMQECTFAFLKAMLYRKNSQEFINDYLPKKLGLIPIDKLAIPAQISGNCSWANVEAAIPAILYLFFQEKKPKERQKNKNLSMLIFRHWERWDQDRALHFCAEGFKHDNVIAKATKAELLGMVLLQSCDYNNPEDLIRAKKILDVLLQPRYQYILKNLIRIYIFSGKSDMGDNFAQLLDYFNVEY